MIRRSLLLLAAVLSCGAMTQSGGGDSGGAGATSVGVSRAMTASPIKYYCSPKNRTETWTTAMTPSCYAFEFGDSYIENATTGYAAIMAKSPPAGAEHFYYKISAIGWGHDLADAQTLWNAVLPDRCKLHHNTSGSVVRCSNGAVACCTGVDDPCFGCTGAGTGTGLPYTDSWTAGDPWDATHMIGKGAAGCQDIAPPYRDRTNRPEGFHELYDPACPELQTYAKAEIQRMKADACPGGGTCPMDGIRVDEPQIAYQGSSGKGIDFSDVTEYSSATSYGAALANLFRELRTAEPDFVYAPSLPFFGENSTRGSIERSIIAAAGAFATETLFPLPYPTVCEWTGSVCAEVASGYPENNYDDSMAALMMLAQMMDDNDTPQLRVIFSPGPVRGTAIIQGLCAHFQDGCYFGIDTSTSDNGDIPPFAN